LVWFGFGWPTADIPARGKIKNHCREPAVVVLENLSGELLEDSLPTAGIANNDDGGNRANARYRCLHCRGNFEVHFEKPAPSVNRQLFPRKRKNLPRKDYCFVWGAHASSRAGVNVLVDTNFFLTRAHSIHAPSPGKACFRGTPKPARGTRALPGKSGLRFQPAGFI
jgi:hypothetical protein